jgi:hypothetical protein
VTSWELVARLLQFVGLLVVVFGLWNCARGMRVVVSGRIDERRESGRSLKVGIALLITGVFLLIGGVMLGNWALTQ